MEIEYIRNIRSSNMLLTCSGRIESMEEIMLTKNRIYGLLPVKHQRKDERTVFYYDITGKQALDALLESRFADEHLLLQIFSGIGGVLERLDKYLLTQNHLLLLPECIFWDYQLEEAWFCYCPGEEADIQDAFRKLIEYLLTKTDHKDEKAVEIVYGVYDAALKPGYSLERIRESLSLWKGSMSSSVGGKDENLGAGEKSSTTVLGQGMSRKSLETDCSTMKSVRKKKNILNQMKMYFQDEFWKNKIMNFFEQKFSLQSKIREMFQGRKQEPEPIVFEPEEEKIQAGRPTVLLAEKKKKPLGILKYEGDHGENDLKLDHFPYLIGSSSACDGVISNETISREHARITKTEEIYFIEDLNSLNGTVVGGELIHYKLKVSLEINETVEFANEKYRFL